MPTSCPVFDPTAPFVPAVIEFVDCRARALGEDGYLALAGVSSPIGLALTGLLTLYVAFFGYRLLMGDTPNLREGVLTAVRLGFVVALATQWPAYQALVYDVVVKGPSSLVGALSGPAGVEADDLPERLHLAYRTLSIKPPETPAEDGTQAAATIPRAPDGTRAGDANARNAALQSDALAVIAEALPSPQEEAQTSARRTLLVSAFAGLLGVRLAAGVLLALGPLFVAALLFDATRGLFEGWVRGLVATALGSIGAVITLGAQLAVLEPQLVVFSERIGSGRNLEVLTEQIFGVNAVFAVLMGVVLGACAVAAFGFRLPAPRQVPQGERRGQFISAPAFTAVAPAPALAAAAAGRSRAVAVAEAAGAMTRREQLAAAVTNGGAGVDRRAASTGEAVSTPQAGAPAAPLGQSRRRTASARGSAARRDYR